MIDKRLYAQTYIFCFIHELMFELIVNTVNKKQSKTVYIIVHHFVIVRAMALMSVWMLLSFGMRPKPRSIVPVMVHSSVKYNTAW